MDISLVLRPFILLSLLAVAAVTDLLKHRVSNNILAIGFIVEAAVHMLSKPVISREALGLSVLFIIVLFILFSVHLIGGADVKLYILCTFTYPNEISLRIICLSVVAGAVYALFIMLKQGSAAERYIRLARYICCLTDAGSGHSAAAAEAPDMEANGLDMRPDAAKTAVIGGGYISDADIAGGAAVPMAAAILAGAILALIQGGIL